MSERNILFGLLFGLLIFSILFGMWSINTYNNIIDKTVEVDNKWADVEDAYQRRVDLIPNLLATVKGYASHEERVLTNITNARANWDNANTPEQKLSAAQDMEESMIQFMVVVEAYPDLKASDNFLSFQSQLEGTENRISTARKRYNDAVGDYNSYILKFPRSIVASHCGFKEREFFEANKGAENATSVEF